MPSIEYWSLGRDTLAHALAHAQIEVRTLCITSYIFVEEKFNFNVALLFFTHSHLHLLLYIYVNNFEFEFFDIFPTPLLPIKCISRSSEQSRSSIEKLSRCVASNSSKKLAYHTTRLLSNGFRSARRVFSQTRSVINVYLPHVFHLKTKWLNELIANNKCSIYFNRKCINNEIRTKHTYVSLSYAALTSLIRNCSYFPFASRLTTSEAASAAFEWAVNGGSSTSTVCRDNTLCTYTHFHTRTWSHAHTHARQKK